MPDRTLDELYHGHVKDVPAAEEEIRLALESDAPRRRDMVERYLSGESYAHIAEWYEVSASTVYGYIRRAMLQAAKRIGGMQPGYHGVGRSSGRYYRLTSKSKRAARE